MAQIDPSIVMGIRPPAVIDPLEQFSKIQGVRNMIQQGQENQQRMAVQQQQIEMGKQNIADKQRADSADQALGELTAKHTIQSADGTSAIDYRAIARGLGERGFGEKSREVLKGGLADDEQTIKNHAAQIKNAQDKVSLLGSSANSLLGVPDDELPGAWDAQAQKLNQQGIQTPMYAEAIQSGRNPRQMLQETAARALTVKDQHDAGLADAKFAEDLNKTQQEFADKGRVAYKEGMIMAAPSFASAKTKDQWTAAYEGLEGLVPLGVLRNFGKDFSPEAVARAHELGMTEEQKNIKPVLGSKTNETTGDVTPTMTVIGPNGVPVMTTGAPAKGIAQPKPTPPSEAAQNTLDRETARFVKPHEDIIKDTQAHLEKIQEARSMINGTPDVQGPGLAKFMTATVSGAGSGIRLTQPELNSILANRGVVEDITSFGRRLAGKGKLTENDQKQLTQILDDIEAKVKEKQSIAKDARDRMNSATSRDQLVKIDKEAGDKLYPPVKPTVNPQVKAYADQYFGGDIKKAQDAIDGQRKKNK